MKYQISFLSPNGHVRKLADALSELLTPDTCITDLENGAQVLGDVQLVGFELDGRNLSAIPLKVIEYLEGLEGKVIFLFATTPFQPSEMIQTGVNRAVTPFLPGDCDYRGMYICAAQSGDEVIAAMEKRAQREPGNARVKHWLEDFRRSVGHPDEEDLRKARDFASHVLK